MKPPNFWWTFFKKISKNPSLLNATLLANAGAKVDKIYLTPNYLQPFFEKNLRTITMTTDYQQIRYTTKFKLQNTTIIYINIGITSDFIATLFFLHIWEEILTLCINFQQNTCNYNIYSYICINNIKHIVKQKETPRD